VKKTAIVIGQIQIADIRSNANLWNGENSARGWRSHSKANYSLGRVNGDANLISSRLNYLSDPDYIDMHVKAETRARGSVPAPEIKPRADERGAG
jgi:hypothetical protein